MEAIHFDHSTSLIANYAMGDMPNLAKASCYSMRFLLRNNCIPTKHLFAAVKKAMELFTEAGVNVRHHFKKIFVVNEDATATYVDWLLTPRALDLILKHCFIVRAKPGIVAN